MIPALYLVVCLIFYSTFVKLRVVTRVTALFSLFQAASLVMLDRELSDTEKETRVRRAAIDSFVGLLALVSRLLAVTGCAILPVVLTSRLTDLQVGAFLDFSLSPTVLVSTLLVMVGLDKARRTWKDRADG